MRRFVIVVDMQRDFVAADGALPVPDAEAVVGPAQAWLAGLTAEDTTGILFTFDTHVPAAYAGSAESEQFPLHCVRGTPGWDLVLDRAAVDPAIPLFWLEKGVFDMWAEADVAILDGAGTATPREAFFAVLKADGVTHVTVIGVAADFCVRWAVDGLVARDFAVDLPEALTRGIGRDIRQVVAEDFAGATVELVA